MNLGDINLSQMNYRKKNLGKSDILKYEVADNKTRNTLMRIKEEQQKQENFKERIVSPTG